MNDDSIRLWIPGRPVPYQRTRPRHGGGVIDDPRYAEWKRTARVTMLGNRRRLDDGTQTIVEIVVESDGVTAQFTPWDGERMRPKHVRGDIDNYTKAVLDAVQRAGRNPFPRGVIDDDRHVVAVTTRFAP